MRSVLSFPRPCPVYRDTGPAPKLLPSDSCLPGWPAGSSRGVFVGKRALVVVRGGL
jgi:hypothetical protein